MRFDEPFENAQWRKVKQIQPMQWKFENEGGQKFLKVKHYALIFHQKSFVEQICWKVVHLFAKDTNLKFGAWSNHTLIIKKTRIFLRAALLCANISQIFFSQLDCQKYLLPVYSRICSTGPLTFPHPSASLLEFQLILVKKSTTTEMGFNTNR